MERQVRWVAARSPRAPPHVPLLRVVADWARLRQVLRTAFSSLQVVGLMVEAQKPEVETPVLVLSPRGGEWRLILKRWARQRRKREAPLFRALHQWLLERA